MNSDEDRVIRLIAETRNRAVLSILNDAARSLTVTELAERLVAHDAPETNATADESELQRVVLSLHHDELPRLDEADLIDYDPDANVVSYETYPSVSAEWLDLELIDELLSCFGSGGSAGDERVGVVEGRDDVIEYGRHLADGAETELFCMYVCADLLEEGCIQSAQDAIERDVELTLGTRDPAVRELVRDRLPEATVWEPQLDWLNDPAQYPTIGRLIFADRKRVMLALMDDADADGRTETAIVGDGADNPLVVLVRELLGARLDHLDYQNEDLLAELPFEP